ncbi:Hpt domain-containing protein [Endozoicomonas ascidiicola]|uniref:Hpt domain-containing protein n=1 Tax=Endozoicomonas ascidiicola TaxID=1698521 RepID=UPI00082AA414|nr:Hpt domain-containing protein [Endozoicomonas ascidiicola]
MLNLDYLKQIADGDVEQVKELLTTFFLVTQEDLVNLKTAINNQQDSLVASIAHRIKGGALIVGASQLTTLAAELEQCGMAPEQQRYSTLFEQIETCLNNLKEHCKNLSD